MKSLEEVIKYKLNFLPKGTEPFYAIQTYTAERGTNPQPSFYDIYRTKNPIFSNDSYSFMEDITPLFIYISSCEKYYRENGHGKIGCIFSALISEDYGELNFVTSHAHDFLVPDEVKLHRMSRVKRDQNNLFLREGYCKRFTKPFKIVFRGGFNHFLTEEEELQREVEERESEEAYYRQEEYLIEHGYYRPGGYPAGEDDDESEEEDTREEFPINDSKTFKSDQCVICLEEEPKVLFCNCGYLCICKKCLVCRFDNCPVCKKENTILRIIE